MAFEDFSSWMGSDGGRAITNAVGAGLQVYGNGQQNKQNAQQQAQQFAANSRQQDYWSQQAQNTSRASSVLAADPLGADQKYAQRNALLSAILPNMRNFRSQPGDPGIAAAMGGDRGGVMNALPAGGLDPNMINAMFGAQSTMGAITQRHQNLTNLDPRAATPDLTSMYGEQAGPAMQQLQQYAQQAQSADASQRAAYEQQMNQLIQQQAQQDKPGGFWHKLAKVAGTVGAIAALAIPGIGPLAAAGIGAASGAAASWGSGSNPLMGGVIGGAAGYANGGSPNPVPRALRAVN